MATREYSINETDELLEALRVAFEEYYENSEIKHLSLGKEKKNLGSDFFRKLGVDSKKNAEEEFSISRSTMESFFKDKTKRIYSNKNSVKINALISFYKAHIYDIEKEEPVPKEQYVVKKPKLHEASPISIKTDKVVITTNELEEKKLQTDKNIKTPKKFKLLKKYRTQIITSTILLLIVFFSIRECSHGVKEDTEELSKNNCKFESDSTKWNILILPFKYIEGDKWTEDKGFYIKQRLDSLNEVDSLNLSIKFCRSIKPSSYDVSFYKNLMKSNNSNHIIYGFVDADETCKGDLICFNYIIDSNYSKNQQLSKNNFERVSNEQLSQGKLQEKMESLIYFNLIVALINKGENLKAIKYIQKQIKIKELDISKEEELSKLFTMQGVAYEHLGLDYLALNSHTAAIYSDDSNITSLGQKGSIFSDNKMYKSAEYYLELALTKGYININQLFNWYFCSVINKTHKRRVFYLDVWIKKFRDDFENKKSLTRPVISKKALIDLMYLLAFSKKEAGDLSGYNLELKKIENFAGKVDVKYGKGIENKIWSNFKYKWINRSNKSRASLKSLCPHRKS